MKVRLRVVYAGPDIRPKRAGSVIEVSKEVGEMLLRTNQADPVGNVESATVRAQEQAARTRKPEPKTADESLTVAELEALCAERGIDIEAIEGSGKDGNVVKADLVKALNG